MGELLLLGERTGALPADGVRLAEAVAGHLALAIWRYRSDTDQAELLRRFEAERSVLESVVNQMPAGVLLADAPSGRIVTANAQVGAIWGKNLRRASQVSDYGLWGGLDGEGRALPAEEWPLARSVLRGETVRGEEIEIERGDGTHRMIRMSSGPVVDGQGRQLAAVATVYDVTSERAAEGHQSFLEEATRTLNSSLELSETVQAVARLVVGRYADWCVVYRRTDAEHVECAAAEHIDPRRQPLVEPFRSAVIRAEGEHPVGRVIREQTPLAENDPSPSTLAGLMGDGREPAAAAVRELGPASLLLLPLVVRDEALGALLLARSERAYGDEEMKVPMELARRAAVAMDNALLYEKARAADRAKSNFLAVMSHEFRTPLSAILGYADILTAEVHGDLNPKQRGHLERVKASVRHLSHLVDEILSFASMEAGRERVRPESAELVSLVADVVGIMEPIAEAAGLELGVELPTSSIEVRIDAQKLRQILINLLSNAIKYTPEGMVRLVLTADRERVLCHVVDTGPGIAPDHRESVFEPFWQVDRGDGRRITGTGLGLAVARRLARLMGGDVTLQSDLGAGSTFTLVLPIDVPTGVAAGRGS